MAFDIEDFEKFEENFREEELRKGGANDSSLEGEKGEVEKELGEGSKDSEEDGVEITEGETGGGNGEWEEGGIGDNVEEGDILKAESFGFSTEGEEIGVEGGGDSTGETGGVEEEEEDDELEEAVEQVNGDMFGFEEDEEASGDSDEEEGGGDGEGGEGKKADVQEKKSFSEIRGAKKIPRLKKGMVLSIFIGGILFFLIVVNILTRKPINERDIGEVGGGAPVIPGNMYTFGDRARERKEEDERKRGEETSGAEEFYFEAPPAYEAWRRPEEGQRAPSTAGTYQGPPAGQGGGEAARPAPGVQTPESVEMALRSGIRKDGGYGVGAVDNFMQMERQGTEHTWTPVEPLSRDEYMDRRIDEVGRLAQAAGAAGYGGAGQGMQGGYANRNTGRYSEAGSYNPQNDGAGEFNYLNEQMIFPGTIIHAVLVSRIDTDYPGPIHARVSENIYDSMTGKNLLIPQGTILQGNYSSSSIGVAKVQIAWEAMVVNYRGVAYQVSLGGMAGVDKRGRAGIAGTLDDHYFEWLKAAGIITMFTLLNDEISYQTGAQKNPQTRAAMEQNQELFNSLGQRIMDRALDIQPTVRVANGKAVSVAVNKAVQLRPFPAHEAEERWVRRR